MARTRASQQRNEAIQQEIQLAPYECAHALRASGVWFRTLLTPDPLPSAPHVTTLFTPYRQQAPAHRRPHRERVSHERLAACSHRDVPKHLKRIRPRPLSWFSKRLLPLSMS